MLEHYKTPLVINGITLDFTKQTHIMGILNVTPDSFSDGGQYTSMQMAVEQAKKMVTEGATIIDVGGESTRPGHVQISVAEEIARVVPVIEALSSEVGAIISIDTYKADVAEAAIKAGAHIINDVWGAKADKRMAHVAAAYDVPIILMHNKADTYYGNFIEEVLADVKKSIQIVYDAGVNPNHIIVDPGIGFGKTTAQNIEMMQNLRALIALGYPVLLATSRKSMIGNVLQLPTAERLEGTMATVVHGIEQGCHIMRLHDVLPMQRAIIMADVLYGKRHYKEEV